jgi:hypothetical protein
MKKIVVIMLATILLFSLSIIATGCQTKDNVQYDRVGCDNIYSDSGYVDYAKEAFYDTEKFPELSEHVMFWTKWNEETETVERVKAATTEGAELVDTQKPTLLLVHGMGGGSYGLNSYERFNLSANVAVPEEFDLETNYVPLIYLWLRAGWNVGLYRWNALTAEGMNFGAVEAKIWSVDGSQKVSHRTPDNELVYGASEYSIVENFAGEYIRAMRLLPSTMGDNEIRVAGHSMGGVLSTTGVFLLSELARYGQIPEKQVPDRLALLDPGFGVKTYIGDKVALSSETDFTINWSKKPLYNKSTSETMIELVKDMTASGIVIEYYAYEKSWVILSILPEILQELNKYSTFVFIDPDYRNYSGSFDYQAQGHTLIFDWYLLSIAFDPVKDVTDENNNTALALCASTPTNYMKENLKGVKFEIVAGQRTVPSSDDLFVREKP